MARTTIRTYVDVHTQWLSESVIAQIKSIPFVELAGHPDAATLRLGVPYDLARDIDEEILRIVGDEPEPTQPTKPVLIQALASAFVTSDAKFREVSFVRDGVTYVGEVIRSYPQNVSGRTEEMLVIRLSKNKTTNHPAKLCKSI